MTETPELASLRKLIEDTAADLSQAEPFWTAGCLATALIAKGVTTSSAFAAREAELVARLRQLSIVLTDHLGGGSEWFSAIGDDYFVDPKAIKAELQRRKTDAQITKRALVRANSREADLVGALEWAGEVSPPVNEFGCVTVDMTLEQLNAMRTLAGFRALKSREARHG